MGREKLLSSFGTEEADNAGARLEKRILLSDNFLLSQNITNDGRKISKKDILLHFTEYDAFEFSELLGVVDSTLIIRTL